MAFDFGPAALHSGRGAAVTAARGAAGPLSPMVARVWDDYVLGLAAADETRIELRILARDADARAALAAIRGAA